MPAESEPAPIHQHPLAYLLGLEGIALLHAFAGEYDRDFTSARVEEIRALLDDEELGEGDDGVPDLDALHRWCPDATNAAYRGGRPSSSGTSGSAVAGNYWKSASASSG